VEVLGVDERFNELVFTALRTKMGVDLVELRSRFGDKRCNGLLRQAQKYVDSGRMQILDNRLSLTREGIYISDSIISDFMIV
jgi:oxygen-independent coproporphyrinogen-3 oxidase